MSSRLLPIAMIVAVAACSTAPKRVRRPGEEYLAKIQLEGNTAVDSDDLIRGLALFRATGPAMNTAVAFYVAHWLGLEPTLAQMVAATAVGAVMSYGAVSLPGEVTYISSIAPIALALGVPIAPLGLLVAVEMVPDIFRTVGNVTHDVTLASIVDRQTR